MTNRTQNELLASYEMFEVVDYEIRAQSTREMRNIHCTTSNSGDTFVHIYYCQSLEKKEGSSRAKRYFSDPKVKPKKHIETEEEEAERVSRCNYFVAVKGIKGEKVNVTVSRSNHTREIRRAVIERKRTHVVMSRTIAQNPSSSHVGESHNSRLTN